VHHERLVVGVLVQARAGPGLVGVDEDHRDRRPVVAAGELAGHGAVDEEGLYVWSRHVRR
jgi:hypothetical protein